ncbi:MAG: efflux RND transporter periplasmic adaptor subunit [Cytophagales bacterium]|nr:efflux RND transporter periplasmic adaptor subunit [Cytophagales bacterium]
MKKTIIYTGLTLLLFMGAFWKLRSNKAEQQAISDFVAQTTKKFPIKSVQAKKVNKALSMEAEGRLFPFKSLKLKSETQGKVEKIFKKKGDKVHRGDLILETENSAIYAGLLAAEANHKQSQNDLDRFEKLYQDEAVTLQQLEQIRVKAKASEAEWIMAKKRFRDSRIQAPIQGVINEDYYEIGEFLGGGMPICDIVDNSKVKLKVMLSEQEILKVQKGQSVKVTTNIHPNKSFEGMVSTVSVQGDNTYRYEVEILIPNPDNELKAGMFARGMFRFPAQEQLLIPRKALVEGVKAPKVYVFSNGKVHLKNIVLNGQSASDQVSVFSGLKENEWVVTDGIFNLVDGMEVEKL